ncbi:MAG: HU family DNA-binding protein [Candidatus Pacebacteria bacterium]|nr:HU family DNA-binding protein [Candidatus Paceibacterota bacterium]
MTKQDLVEEVAKKTKLPKSEVSTVVNAVVDTITEVLSKKGGDNSVVLTGFGTFTVSKRKARTGRNPKTGETIKIAATRVPRFKAGKSLKDAVK